MWHDVAIYYNEGGVFMNYKSKLSKLAEGITSSIIRELLKFASEPGFISFGGGVPDPETFPRKELAEIAKEVIEKEYRFSLQYGTTEGDPLLKAQYIRYLERWEGLKGLTENNLLITVGSQQALDLIARTFLDEGSIVALSLPAYLGAVSAFKMRNPRFLTVPLSEDGMETEILEKKLESLSSEELQRFKFVYTVPNFHNPAGVTLSLERRKHLLELAERFDFFIVEDDPYGALRFEGEHVPSIFKLGGMDRVVLLNTFSKVLSPGLRIGLVIAHESVISRLVRVKQGVDLCSPSLTQRIVARYMERYDMLAKLKETLEIYREKKDVMMKAFERHLSDIGARWTRPKGGLFSWIVLPEDFDALEMLEIGKEHKILWIPGSAFHVDGSGQNTMRVSYCLPSKEEIGEGVERMRRAMEAYKKAKVPSR